MELDGKTAGSVNTTSLIITSEVLTLIAEIDEFKGTWRAVGRIAPERLSALRRVATIESIGSSTRIEGAALSNREVERLLSNLEIQTFTSRDEQEVAGYASVMETVFESADAIDLTENHIRQLHRDLLQFSDKDTRHRGAYKTLPNHVEAIGPDGESLGVVFETATPFDTPRLMSELVVWARAQFSGGNQHALIVIAIFVVVFLQIHPFQDGNGRLSRILTTLLLLRAGYAYVPYSSLESIVEASKEAYYLALRQTQGTIRSKNPDWQPWLRYFLNALLRQKARLERKLERERILSGSLPELSARLINLCEDHGRLTVSAAVRLTGANRSTVKDHLSRLTKAGHMVRHGAGRGSWYGLV
ncbi:MAG: Fic family protein [Gammaproteobacteria bacterium]